MKEEEKTNLTDVVSSEESAPESENVSEELEEGVSTASEDETNDNDTRLPPNVVERKRRVWVSYVITCAILAVLTLLIAMAEDCYTKTETWLMLERWGSAIAISGILGVSSGLLIGLSNGGAFDIFAYGGRIFARMFIKKDVKDRKYPTYYDYREARKKKKRAFWYVVIVGGCYLLVGVVVSVVGNQLMPKP